MQRTSDPPSISTRQSARRFGLNLTNLPADPQNPPKKNTPCQWLAMHPEIAPYFPQITQRNKANEGSSYISDNYMLWHSDITVPMRQLLIGWLISLQHKMKLTPSTLYLAVSIIDKYCYQKFIARERYQLLGLTSLFIAAKYQEIKTPRLKRYVESALDAYHEDDVLAMEGEILILLGFNLKVMTVVDCLQQQMTFLGYDERIKQFCRYVLDLTLLEYWSCLVKPSAMVWAVVAKVGQIRGVWDGRTDEEGREALKLVNVTYLQRQEGKYKDVHAKYHQTFSQ